MLEIKNLHVSVDNQEILKGLSLAINRGEVYSIMGPNGSGKSTLAQVLAGRDTYDVTEGEIIYQGKNLLEISPKERACMGIFMAFQYPVEILGVNNTYLLRTALNAQRKFRGLEPMKPVEFAKLLKEKAKIVQMSDDILQRSVNEGFLGGEKKRNEIFQMAVLEPTLG